MKFEFEDIDNYHRRAKVPGGWLVKVSEPVVHDSRQQGMVSGWDWRVAMTFIPDPKHEWIIEAND